MTTEQERTEGLELQKVGIQILSDEGLANIFPNYEDLLDNIEKCRKRICQANRKGHYQYNLMYDNVFSIIGKRGTGKTSAIFTLKKLIEEKSVQEQTQDLLLPIIMPELFSGKDGILEWILAGLEDEVDRIEKNVQKSDAQQFYQACRYPMDKQSNLLRKKYEQLLEQKFSDKYKAESADSYYEAIGNSAKQVKNSYQLIKNIYEFWDILIESIQNTSGMEKHMKEPLIYFFFDDIDLSPDKVEELLTAIRVYLAHPNLIVIITADEDVFLEVIENKMDEKMGRLQKDKRKYLWAKTNETFYDSYGMFYPTVNPMKENAEDGLSDMARMYLGKILPPSSRYYLKIFQHPEDRKNFVCSVGNNTVSLFELLNMQINRLTGLNANSTENFLHYKKEKIIFYLEFIGDTARQISNELWIINNLVNNLHLLYGNQHTEQEKVNLIYNYICSFLHTTFVNNHHIIGIINNTDVFIREIIKKEYNDWKLYVNYNYLNHFLQKYGEEYADNKELISDIGMKIYAVLYFVENILLILEKKGLYRGNRKKIHGLHHFIDFLSAGGLERNLLRTAIELDEFLNQYGNLLINIDDLKDEDSTNVRFIRKYFYKFASIKSMDISLDDIYNWYIRDQKWLKKICQIMFLYFEHIYRFDKENMEKSLLTEKEYLQFLFEVRVAAEMRANFVKFVSVIGLREEAKNQNGLIRRAFYKLTRRNELNARILSRENEGKIKNWFQQKKFVTVTQVLNQINVMSLFPKIQSENWDKILMYISYDVLEPLIIRKLPVSLCQEILMQVWTLIEWYKEQMKYIIILDVKKVLECMTVLEEYRDGEYADEIQNFRNAIPAFGEEFEGKIVLKRRNPAVINFLQLIQDISRDALTGSRVVTKSYSDSYVEYSNTCEEIYRCMDLGIDAGDLQEVDNGLKLLENIYVAKVIQQLLFIGTVINNLQEINYNQNNIYFELYRFVRDNIIKDTDERKEQDMEQEQNVKRMKIILKNNIEKWIKDAKKDYLNKVLSNETYRVNTDE